MIWSWSWSWSWTGVGGKESKTERAGEVDVFRVHVVHHPDAMAVNRKDKATPLDLFGGPIHATHHLQAFAA